MNTFDPGTSSATGSSRALVGLYLAAFYTGDFARARSVVAEDFRFKGPFLEVEGKDAFFVGAEGLRLIVNGHRLLRQWVDGDQVCSIYEVAIATPAGHGAVVMSEWHTVKDGRLSAAQVIFDTAAFRQLVTGGS